ncbi:hypothetical protein G9A89_000407 [Geosiphon pyriformis]|nr:hypothetical protein G9A89_000407 [Geosiphon pyriformis]
MKKTAKVSGSESGFKAVVSRKKRKGGALAEGVGNRGVAAEVPGGCSWSSETGNTIESESVDMEEECLVEETSFNYGEGGALAGGNYDQTPTNLKVKTKKALGKPLRKIDFSKDSSDDSILSDAPLELPPPMKNLVNVPVRKSFMLDIGLDKVAGKFSQEKLVVVRKLFSGINSFGGGIYPLKILRDHQSDIHFQIGSKKATEKATGANVMVNTDLKRSADHSDRAVVLKEIPVGTSAEAVHAVLSEFGIIKSIKMQLVGLWQKAVVEFEQSEHADLVTAEWSILIGKDAVWVARSDLDKESWNARNQHRALLYTLPIGTTAHNIWDFIGSVGEKTCFIDCHPVTYVRARCAVVCFDSAESLKAIMETTPVLRAPIYAGLVLFQPSVPSMGNQAIRYWAICLCVESSPVARSVSFGGLSWTKVASGSSFPPLFGRNALVKSGFSSELVPFLLVSMEVNDRFTALERSLTSLAEQVGKLAKRLDALGPTVSQPSSGCQPLVTLSSQNQGADIVISEGSGAATSGEIVVEAVSFDVSLVSKLEDSMKCLMETVLGLSAKVDSFGLKEKICPWIVNKYDDVWVFTSGLESGYLGAGVAVVMNSSLVRHVCKVSKVSGWLLSIKLLFKNKLSVSILGLYAGAFSAVWFSQAGEVNFLIAKAVNESSFIVLSGDFNEDSSYKCASFKKCLNLGLVNALDGSSCGKSPTWSNSQGIAKMIDFMFVSSNLVNAITVSVLVGLGGADDGKWAKENMAANAAMFYGDFLAARICSDLDLMWVALCKVICLSAEAVFKKKWFKEYNKIFSKDLSKFHKLELLVSKLVRASHMDSAVEFASLLNRKSQIRSAIDKRMESFKLDKGHTIRSVLECLFHKVTLDHLIVDDKLVLEPTLVKTKVDAVMKEWTRKHNVVFDVTGVWNRQYQPLKYVFDDTFSGVISLINFDKMSNVVSNLPDGKAAGLSSISNELWKHCDKSVLDMLLKEAWVSMILKPYEWEGVLTNTHPIALVETARKILSKVFSDRISSACSVFDILRGDNFSVLKDTTMQSPIFAIGSVIEDVLEKNRKLWLVLQDMQKAYDSVGWEHLRKSLFFGSIHNDWVNRVITDFGLTNGYQVHDGLDQEEVFSPLLWCIFYDPLLCEVKRQESVCGYRLDSRFVANTGHIKSWPGLTSFLAAGAFVDDTIWIGSSQTATQHILNVAISSPHLLISGLPILIAKRGELHRYLGIFLSTESLSKLSLAKACLDAISDKQFSYLVSAGSSPHNCLQDSV